MRLLLLIFALVAFVSARWNYPRYEWGRDKERSLGYREDYKKELRETERDRDDDDDDEEQDDEGDDGEDRDVEVDDKESDEDEEQDTKVDKRHRHRHHKHRHHKKHRHHHRRHHRKGPKVCKKLKCLPFKTVKRYRGFELRCYRNASFVVTRADKVDQKDFRPLFKRLFDYIRGANADNATFKMTAPVLVGMFYNISTHKTKSAMSFYFPYPSPPAPTNDKVSLYNARGFCAYVRPFYGRVRGRDRTYYLQLYILSKAIRRYKKDYQRGFSTFAGYSSPRERYQYNEVWRIPARRRPTVSEVPEFIPTSTWDFEEEFQENSNEEEETQNEETMNEEEAEDEETEQLDTTEQEPQVDFEEEGYALVTP